LLLCAPNELNPRQLVLKLSDDTKHLLIVIEYQLQLSDPGTETQCSRLGTVIVRHLDLPISSIEVVAYFPSFIQLLLDFLRVHLLVIKLPLANLREDESFCGGCHVQQSPCIVIVVDFDRTYPNPA
jgi:hypothetical protein